MPLLSNIVRKPASNRIFGCRLRLPPVADGCLAGIRLFSVEGLDNRDQDVEKRLGIRESPASLGSMSRWWGPGGIERRAELAHRGLKFELQRGQFNVSLEPTN